MIIENIPMSNGKMKTFEEETSKDEEMTTLIELISNGWPSEKSLVPALAKPYFYFNEELSTINGLVFKNSRVVVPKSLRKDMLYRIHYSHLGIEKCKNKARDLLYWPGMSKAVEDLVSNCVTCKSFQKANSKEHLMPKEVPHGPWEVFGTDLFHFQGKEHLIVIDYFSKFVETEVLTELTSVATIQCLKKMFARFGIPKIVYSDNGPQYNTEKFRRFAKDWNFETRTSSPLFPQSNGMVERHIETVKYMLKKALHDNRDPHLALLEYRNTPISSDIPSPSELMFNRKINGLMPRREDFFPTRNHEDTREKLIARQQKQKKYFDKGCRDLPEINEGDVVFINDHQQLKGPNQPAKVLGKTNRPRSYRLQKEDGREVERNRKHIIRGPKEMTFDIKHQVLLPEFNNADQSSSNHHEPVSDTTPKHASPGKTVPSFSLPEDTQRTLIETDDEPDTCTRYGRRIKKPSYLKDYF